MAEFLFRGIGYAWLALILLGAVLGYQRNGVASRLGKSMGCLAFSLANWGAISDFAYKYTRYVTDVWRWYPAVLFGGILAICLLIIWKPFSKRTLLAAILSLVGILLLVTAVVALTWRDDRPPIYADLGPIWRAAHSIFEELGRIARWTGQTHFVASIVALAMFLSFRKNQVLARIGKSTLCGLLLALIWDIPVELQILGWVWPIGIICGAVFLACLYFIWRPNRRRRGNE